MNEQQKEKLNKLRELNAIKRSEKSLLKGFSLETNLSFEEKKYGKAKKETLLKYYKNEVEYCDATCSQYAIQKLSKENVKKEMNESVYDYERGNRTTAFNDMLKTQKEIDENQK